MISSLRLIGAIAAALSSSTSAMRSDPPQLVLFASGSAVPRPGAAKALRMLSTGDYKRQIGFIVAGHTDRVGEKEANERLSCRRAQKVRDMMVARGVPPDDILLQAFGESRPAWDTSDEVADPRNRRVEIMIYPLPVPSDGTNTCT